MPDSVLTDSTLLVFVSALIGLLLGSFLNVCIFRLPLDLSIVTPRSFCPGCEQAIAWYDNIPILSFLLLRGRCRQCRERISLRYPAVELMTALCFGVVAYRYGATAGGLKWVTFEAVMVVLFWTDLETQILPDELTLVGTVAGFLFSCWAGTPGLTGEMLAESWKPMWQSLLNATAGALLLAGPLWLAGAVYGRIRNRDALGLGDVKLLLLIGSFLGVGYGLLTLMVGAIVGSVMGIAVALLTRKQWSTYELPFGTFLCGAAGLIPLVMQIGA